MCVLVTLLQINASSVGAKSLHYSSGQHNAKVSSDAISDEYKVVDHSFDAVVVGAGMCFVFFVHQILNFNCDQWF